MTPLYHSPFLIDLNEGQQHDQLFFSKSTEEEAASYSSYVSILNNPSQEFADYYHRDLQPLIQHQAEVS